MKLLKQNDFIFTKHPHKNGLSGQKLWATRNADGKRFVVKHEEALHVSNEFVFYSMAKALGLHTPEVYLFEVDLSRKLFKSGCAIAIEYIESERYLEWPNENSGIHNWKDFYTYRALRGVVYQDDGVEILLSKDGYMYSIDWAEAFEANTDMIYRFINSIFRECQEKATAKDWEDIFVDTLLDWVELPKEKIIEVLDDLREVFPQETIDFYLDFLRRSQGVCKYFLKEKFGGEAE